MSQEKKQLEELIQKVNSLETKVSGLETKLSQFKLMYKRPGGTEYETLAQTLDYLHKALDRRS
jgi:uncharacterized protein YbaP (TraB family)